jgi:hypothetical protein
MCLDKDCAYIEITDDENGNRIYKHYKYDIRTKEFSLLWVQRPPVSKLNRKTRKNRKCRECIV